MTAAPKPGAAGAASKPAATSGAGSGGGGTVGASNHTYEIVRHGKDGDEKLSKDEVLMRVIETGRHYVFNKRTKTSRWVTTATAAAIASTPSPTTTSSPPSAAPIINKATTPSLQKHHQQHHHHPQRVVNGGGINDNVNGNNNIKYNENDDERIITEGISSTSISKDTNPSQTGSSLNKHDNDRIPTSSSASTSSSQARSQFYSHPSDSTTSGTTTGTNGSNIDKNTNTGQHSYQHHHHATNNNNPPRMTSNNDNSSSNSTNSHHDNTNNDQESDEVEAKLKLLTSLVDVVEQMTTSGKYKMSDLQQAVDDDSVDNKEDTKQKLLQLGEFLTQQMLKVDDVESGGNPVVRAKRKQTINFIIAFIERVEQLNAKLKKQ